jgi:hypothetical protein
MRPKVANTAVFCLSQILKMLIEIKKMVQIKHQKQKMIFSEFFKHINKKHLVNYTSINIFKKMFLNINISTHFIAYITIYITLLTNNEIIDLQEETFFTILDKC